MSNTWNISDDQLREQLTAVKTGLWAGTSFFIRLFKNDFTPAPGTELSDFVEADFYGYSEGEIDNNDWGSVTVTDHIAKIIHLAEQGWQYSAGGGTSPQTIYGYYVVTTSDEYVWCERFDTAKLMVVGAVLKLTPEFRYRTYPASS